MACRVRIRIQSHNAYNSFISKPDHDLFYYLAPLETVRGQITIMDILYYVFATVTFIPKYHGTSTISDGPHQPLHFHATHISLLQLLQFQTILRQKDERHISCYPGIPFPRPNFLRPLKFDEYRTRKTQAEYHYSTLMLLKNSQYYEEALLLTNYMVGGA